MRKKLLGVFAALLCLIGSGCGPSDPLDAVISADNATALAMSRSRMADRLTPQQLKDFDDAVRELKLSVMANQEATGTDAVDEAMRAKIHQHTIRDAMRLGLESQIKRLEIEQKGLLIATEQNSRLITRPGDTASSNYLAGFREKQNARLQAAENDLRTAHEKLKALEKVAKP